MADSLNSLGSIATHLLNLYPQIPTAVSGIVLVEIIDMARQHVANYTGVSIGSNSIADRFQPALLDFAKADLIDMINAQAGGENITLSDLSISETGESMSAEQYRVLAELKLRSLGRDIKFRQSLS